MPEKYRTLVAFEINRIIRELSFNNNNNINNDSNSNNSNNNDDDDKRRETGLNERGNAGNLSPEDVPWRRDTIKIEYNRVKNELEVANNYISELQGRLKALEMVKLESEALITGYKSEVERLKSENEGLKKASHSANFTGNTGIAGASSSTVVPQSSSTSGQTLAHHRLSQSIDRNMEENQLTVGSNGSDFLGSSRKGSGTEFSDQQLNVPNKGK